MEMVINSTSAETHGALKEEEFSIEMNDVAYMVLSTMLYSNPARSATRENMTNVVDAYVQLGGALDRDFRELAAENPPEIHLPTNAEPWISFRDYGIGLDEEKITRVVSKFFASDKRGDHDSDGTVSDANTLHGGFGLGLKSNNSISESWVLTAWKNGQKVSYSIYEAEGRHKLTQLINEPSDEPTGVEIKVPVANKLFYDLERAVNSLMAYLPIPFVIDGELRTPELPEYVLKGRVGNAKWGLRTRDHNGVQVIVGAVAYPIDTDELTLTGGRQSPPIDLFVPIGSVDLPPSRESVVFTAKTKAFLNEVLNEVIDKAIPLVIEKSFETDKATPWEKRKIYHDIRRRFYGTLSKVLPQGTIPEFVIDSMVELNQALGTEKLQARIYHNVGRWGSAMKNVKSETLGQRFEVCPDRQQAIFFDDCPKGGRARVRDYILTQDDTCRVLVFHGERDTFEDWFEDLRRTLGYAPIQLTSSLPEPESTGRAGSGNRSVPDVVLLGNKGQTVDELPEDALYLSTYRDTVIYSVDGSKDRPGSWDEANVDISGAHPVLANCPEVQLNTQQVMRFAADSLDYNIVLIPASRKKMISSYDLTHASTKMADMKRDMVSYMSDMVEPRITIAVRSRIWTSPWFRAAFGDCDNSGYYDASYTSKPFEHIFRLPDASPEVTQLFRNIYHTYLPRVEQDRNDRYGMRGTLVGAIDNALKKVPIDDLPVLPEIQLLNMFLEENDLLRVALYGFSRGRDSDETPQYAEIVRQALSEGLTSIVTQDMLSEIEEEIEEAA